jgi:hypothetical protein
MCTDFDRLTIEDSERGLSGTSYFARLFDVSLETQLERDANITQALDKAREVQAAEAAAKAGYIALQSDTVQSEVSFAEDVTADADDRGIRHSGLAMPGLI